MTMLSVNLVGVALIVFIVWWFWLARPAGRRAGDEPIEVTVADGAYSPTRIETTAGRPLTLRFLRRDPAPCAEKVIFHGLGVTADLPLDTPRDVTLRPSEPGEYEFTCDMQMYRGSLVVK
jgi:plastocyanin domain-containing protein